MAFSFATCANAVRGPEDLSRRVADEAGPDEYGMVNRKPGAPPRPPICRVCHAASGTAQTPERRAKVHSKKSDPGSPSPRDHLSQEDGLSHSIAPMVWRPGQSVYPFRSAA